MMRVISTPTWGATILEDMETGELSFQCVCGGVGMYWQRVLLTPEEVEHVRNDTFDADRMVSDVCKRAGTISSRLVAAVDPSVFAAGDENESG